MKVVFSKTWEIRGFMVCIKRLDSKHLGVVYFDTTITDNENVVWQYQEADFPDFDELDIICQRLRREQNLKNLING